MPAPPRPARRFGLWHLLKGPSGLDDFKVAVQRLGEDYDVSVGSGLASFTT